MEDNRVLIFIKIIINKDFMPKVTTNTLPIGPLPPYSSPGNINTSSVGSCSTKGFMVTNSGTQRSVIIWKNNNPPEKTQSSKSSNS